MAQGKRGCSQACGNYNACVSYNGKQRLLNNGPSEIQFTYKHDFKRVGSR